MATRKKWLLAACFAAVLATKASAQTGAYSVGDCLIGNQFSSCRSHLGYQSASDGIDYLTESDCPGCEPLITQMSPNGGNVISWVCPEDRNWSHPIASNLDTANPHYDVADMGQTGAEVIGFDARVCWEGGYCEPGPCEIVLTSGGSNPNGPVFQHRCPKVGGKIWYVIKIFGAACEDSVYASEEPGET